MKRTIYKSDSILSVSIIVNGVNRRINFNEITGTGSIYIPTSQEEADALEKHYLFGTNFKKIEEIIPDAVNSDDAQPKETSFTKVNVTCLDDAVDYIADNFGVSRTKMRGIKSLMLQAQEHGIEFVGLEEE